jgi:hypothetical protein
LAARTRRESIIRKVSLVLSVRIGGAETDGLARRSIDLEKVFVVVAGSE